MKLTSWPQFHRLPKYQQELLTERAAIIEAQSNVDAELADQLAIEQLIEANEDGQ